MNNFWTFRRKYTVNEKKVVLVIDDEQVNRKILVSYLEDNYEVHEFDNGNGGIEYIKEHCRGVSAVLLDLCMPNLDGFEFLKIINENCDWKNIPIIITTGLEGIDNEKRALNMGAWDYIRKPYDKGIVKARLRNAIYRSQLSTFNELKYIAEYDPLTGMYNKKKFYDVTREMLRCNNDKKFVFIRFDVDRFQMVNSFFGYNEGDKLLVYIGKQLKDVYSVMPYATFGRIESDVFGICHRYDESTILRRIADIRNMLAKYNPEYDIVPNLGLYVIEDNNLPMETIFNRATLASNYSKGNYVKFYTFYNDNMSKAIIHEQEIINDMKCAIEKEQFDLYFQPKYSLENNKPYGAEVLVRWFHPTKGMVMPGEFIPILEKNGYISKLDYYVWEKACKYLRKWMDEGRTPYPISVNVSRVNMYNPKIVDIIKGLTDKYNVPPALLNLELTESAYVENPVVIKDIITKLQLYGFIILMDDFGSGYSSLNTLKDISVDILKVDMRFLSNTDIPGRGDNILASVIRMAKWINLPVVVEGVETYEQARFLRSIGCDYVQGYYFASPMPVEDYLKLIDSNEEFHNNESGKNKSEDSEQININALFEKNPQMEMIFGNNLQTIVIYEYSDGNVELLRVNEGFYDMFGSSDTALKIENVISIIDENYKENVISAFETAIRTKKIAEAEYERVKNNGTNMWVKLRLQYIQKIGNKHLLFGTLNDITAQKEIDSILSIYRKEVDGEKKKNKGRMLIVDDYRLNRLMLAEMFSDKYDIVEAENGNDALIKLKESGVIDIIILDLIMPYMDGKEFLSIIKKDEKYEDIPVIVMTSDSSKESQMELISLGISDYITKPFVRETVLKRIDNVMESVSRKNNRRRKNDIADKLSELFG